jgi:hypothetical protein
MRHNRLRPWLAATVAGIALCGFQVSPSSADSPNVEHNSRSTFVDDQFSGFLTQSCGFPVTVTVTEMDTFVTSDHVEIGSVHITATVVGNNHTIGLRTDSSLVTNGQVNVNAGLIVQVRDAAGRRLTQISGQLRTLSDGSTVFHGSFPIFDLCDFLQ